MEGAVVDDTSFFRRTRGLGALGRASTGDLNNPALTLADVELGGSRGAPGRRGSLAQSAPLVDDEQSMALVEAKRLRTFAGVCVRNAVRDASQKSSRQDSGPRGAESFSPPSGRPSLRSEQGSSGEPMGGHR